MRQSITLFTILLFTTSNCFAQSTKKSTTASHISLGPVASLGHSWVSNIRGNRYFKFSPALGIGLVLSQNEHLGFGAQLLVSHEGYSQSVALPNDAEVDVKVNTVYLRVPLHLIYFFGKYGDRVRMKIYAGPSFGVLVGETQHSSDNLLRPAPGGPGTNDQFKRFDAGMTAGTGANVRLNKATWLNVDAGYHYGLMDAKADATDRIIFNNNNNLRLNVGVLCVL